MAAFTLDTSGEVSLLAIPDAHKLPDHGPEHYWRTWSDLDPFTQGFGDAMARELYERLLSEGWTPDDAVKAVAFRNWAPETLARIIADCADLIANTVEKYRGGPAWGEQFWRERGEPHLAKWEPLTPYLGDEGRVYLREPT